MQDNATISAIELFQMFPDAESARIYFERRRWNGQVSCPHCACFKRITKRGGKRLGYYRCCDCGGEFTVRTGTIFERSHVPLHKWLYAMYLIVTARKGVSNLQLSKEIGVTPKTAWFILGRLREACGGDSEMLEGIVDVDETYIGDQEKNKRADKRMNQGDGTGGTQAVMGMRERGGGVVAKPIESASNDNLRGEIDNLVEARAMVYANKHRSFSNLPNYIRKRVKHSAGRYVGANGVHINGIESVLTVLKRGLYGVWHKVSFKHFHRYVNEATIRPNEGNVKVHTFDRLASFSARSLMDCITYKDLTA